MIVKYASLFLILIYSIGINAQTVGWIEKTDEELAIQFYQDGEIEKARALFEDLIKKGDSGHLNDYYFNCLLKLEDYKEAEKFLKKEIKRSNSPEVLTIDLGYVYGLAGEKKDSEKTYESVLENISSDEITVQAVASAFERRGLDDYAIKTYEIGRKKAGSDDFFAKPLAELYGDKGRVIEMVEEYLRFCRTNPSGVDEVKSALASFIEEDAKYTQIKEVLIKKTQEDPDNGLYVDLLSWAFVSKKEFFPAFIQLKALDKRKEQGGAKVFQLAKVCVQNKEYRVAEKAYEYIMSYGRNSPYFYQAKLGAINMKYARVTETGNYTEDELTQIESDYKVFIADKYIPFGEKYKGYLRLAEIQAVYLNHLDDAINNLTDLVDNPRIPQVVRGQIKLDLADYLLMRGDIWDAKLKYWQVEKDFKDNPLAHRAKFMKAKISFYTGEFELAQTFLSVLKGSTSELIANDALHLSMLIQDNLGLDTIATPLELYAKADRFLFMNQLENAEATLDTITTFFPNHELDDEVFLLKGDIELKRRNYDLALKNYGKVFTNHADDLLADDALYKAANILEYRMDDEQTALILLEKLVLEYQSSVFSVDARSRYRVLSEKYADQPKTIGELFWEMDTP